MSRPEKPIDWDKVNQFLEAGCLGTEIAPHFDMHPETFYDRVKDKYGVGFTEYSSLKKQKGDSLLKQVQFNKALEGDNTMLIWLGKHRLNQKENAHSTDRHKDDVDKILDNWKKEHDQHAVDQNHGTTSEGQ